MGKYIDCDFWSGWVSTRIKCPYGDMGLGFYFSTIGNQSRAASDDVVCLTSSSKVSTLPPVSSSVNIAPVPPVQAKTVPFGVS